MERSASFSLLYFDSVQKEIMESIQKTEIKKEVNDNLPAIGKTYYNPHQGVIRENYKTLKLIAVHDVFPRLKGPSLNDYLEACKSRDTDLFGSLIRFRLHNIAVVADIEKSFLNSRIQEDDSYAVRISWKEDLFHATSKLKVLQFTKLGFGLASSMFYLEATIDHHLNCCLEDDSDINVDIINKIRHSLYVDD